MFRQFVFVQFVNTSSDICEDNTCYKNCVNIPFRKQKVLLFRKRFGFDDFSTLLLHCWGLWVFLDFTMRNMFFFWYLTQYFVIDERWTYGKGCTVVKCTLHVCDWVANSKLSNLSGQKLVPSSSVIWIGFVTFVRKIQHEAAFIPELTTEICQLLWGFCVDATATNPVASFRLTTVCLEKLAEGVGSLSWQLLLNFEGVVDSSWIDDIVEQFLNPLVWTKPS